MAQLNTTQVNGNLTVTGKASLASTADTTPTSNYDLTSKKYVDDQISELNSNLITGSVNRDGKVIQYSLAAFTGENIKTGCFEPGIYIYGSSHSGAPDAWPGFMISIPVIYGSEGFTRGEKFAFTLNGEIYFMSTKNNGTTIDMDWVKVASRA